MVGRPVRPRPTRSATTLGMTTHAALPPETALMFSAKLRRDVLNQRDGHSAISHAVLLKSAIGTRDYAAMSAASLWTVNEGMPRYRPSGGRPRSTSLSDYLSAQTACAGSEEERQAYVSGMEGNLNLKERPQSMLDESWTLIGGYRNSGGETDLLAVGPFGICAMEVKNYQGLISADSDRWTRNPYDRYGNPSTRERAALIEDASGRSPSKQVGHGSRRAGDNHITQDLQTDSRQARRYHHPRALRYRAGPSAGSGRDPEAGRGQPRLHLRRAQLRPETAGCKQGGGGDYGRSPLTPQAGSVIRRYDAKEPQADNSIASCRFIYLSEARWIITRRKTVLTPIPAETNIDQAPMTGATP